MNPTIFPVGETEFTTNGLGRVNPKSCLVTEERNGMFELDMEIDISDKHFGDLKEGRLLYAPFDDTKKCQPFEIYRISAPMEGTVTVNAWHISYRTAKITVKPVTAASSAAAVTALQANVMGDCPFTLSTDIVREGNFTVEKPETLRSRLGGSEGSLLDVYGGEYVWDKYQIRLKSQRGSDTDVVIRYGKNLTELQKTTDFSEAWDSVVPFWLNTDEESGSSDLVIYPNAISTGVTPKFGYRMTIPLDLSSEFQEKPTTAQLRERALAYLRDNAPTGVPTSIEVSFVQLWQTQEYARAAALERLKLCDTVTIRHERLGIDHKAKIVKTVYDVLRERYDSMTIGEVRTNLGDIIRESAESIRRESVSRSAMQRAIEAATNLIRGGLGGHVVINTDSDGKPNEILIMDTESTATAVKVLRINMNGIGFSSNGYNGPFHSAWTLDGAFVADFITAGTLNAAIIKAGILQDAARKNYWDMTTGEFRLAATSTVGGKTVDQIASDAVGTLDGALNQQGIFNRLTNNGQTQGIYLSNGKLYINATYIATGILADANSNTTFNLSTGQLDIKKGTINLGSGNFTVDNNGNVTANNFSGKGSFYCGTESGLHVNITGGSLYAGYGTAYTGRIDFSRQYQGEYTGRGLALICDDAISLETSRLYVKKPNGMAYSGETRNVSIPGVAVLSFLNGLLIETTYPT